VTSDEQGAFAVLLKAVLGSRDGESVWFADVHIAGAIAVHWPRFDDCRSFVTAAQTTEGRRQLQTLFVSGYRTPIPHDGFFPGPHDAPDSRVCCVLTSGEIWRCTMPRGATGRPLAGVG
jgi:hypothetical protein